MRAEVNTSLAEARPKQSGDVRIGLLGDFTVKVGDRKVDEKAWRLRKAASLIKLLALAPGHRIHRERAMDLLWPKLGIRAASNNLRQALHVARRKLHPDPEINSRYLSVSGEQLLMCPQGQLWVDVDAFEEAAETARRSEDPAAYRTAIELYSGELLPKTATRVGGEPPSRAWAYVYFSSGRARWALRGARGGGFGTCRPGSSEGAGRGANQRGGARGAHAPVRLLRAIGRSPEAVRHGSPKRSPEG